MPIRSSRNPEKASWATAVAIKAPVAGAIGQITKLSVTLRSDPIDVGTFDVNEDGIAIINFVVPDVPIGLHHLELTGDDGRTYVIPMYITAEPTDSAPVFLCHRRISTNHHAWT